jgi:hypothetical protein
LSPTCAKRRSNGKLFAPGLRSYLHQVRHIRADQQEHYYQRSHQNLENGAHVSNNILLQRMDVGFDSQLLKCLPPWRAPPAQILSTRAMS